MSSEIEAVLSRHRTELVGFLRRRVADPSVAEDVLQDALLRVIKSSTVPETEQRLLPWFYAVLRNAAVDTHRRAGAQSRRRKHLHTDLELEELHREEHTEVCECIRGVLPVMNPDYAFLIERMDLEEADAGRIAEELSISRGNLKVRHHRARQQLRSRLMDACRTCAEHGCLDCTCRV